ncbi:MAG TPA: dihydroorotate dehydrogenase electron transfer subunit [Halanaerobiales bacterium]|nr:dihydroorotate dehydrogenase electron transfer subunit [Halanaerobiales bacterium]
MNSIGKKENKRGTALVEDLTVLENYELSRGYYLMQLVSGTGEPPLPGQFYQFKIKRDNYSHDPLLRRPLSIHNFDREKKVLSFLYRVVGRGTELLSSFITGERVNILGPLGNGFSTDLKDKNILIIGGGMGVAPLFYLARELMSENKVKVFLGFNNFKEADYFDKEFQSNVCKAQISTLDGSYGYKGNVLELLNDYTERVFNGGTVDYFYTCGPGQMLAELQQFSRKYRIPGEVSLEERMGCGTGVCLSCVCKTVDGNRRVCSDGPAFNIQDVIFKGGAKNV